MTQTTMPERTAEGISTLMGRPRLPIIVRPTSRNVCGVIDPIERLKLNHVPQKTPATSEKNKLSNFHVELLVLRRIWIRFRSSEQTNIRLTNTTNWIVAMIASDVHSVLWRHWTAYAFSAV